MTKTQKPTGKEKKIKRGKSSPANTPKIRCSQHNTKEYISTFGIFMCIIYLCVVGEHLINRVFQKNKQK